MERFDSILLIDDDDVTHYINKRLIKKLSLCRNVELAMNGAEAIRYLETNCKNKYPELIFLDLNMPVMDGFEFLELYDKLCFEDKSAIKIIILTSSSNENDVKIRNHPSIIGYVTKPLTEEKLSGIIKSYF